jgi:hypothetical protein
MWGRVGVCGCMQACGCVCVSVCVFVCKCGCGSGGCAFVPKPLSPPIGCFAEPFHSLIDKVPAPRLARGFGAALIAPAVVPAVSAPPKPSTPWGPRMVRRICTFQVSIAAYCLGSCCPTRPRIPDTHSVTLQHLPRTQAKRTR